MSSCPGAFRSQPWVEGTDKSRVGQGTLTAECLRVLPGQLPLQRPVEKGTERDKPPAEASLGLLLTALGTHLLHAHGCSSVPRLDPSSAVGQKGTEVATGAYHCLAFSSGSQVLGSSPAHAHLVCSELWEAGLCGQQTPASTCLHFFSARKTGMQHGTQHF